MTLDCVTWHTIVHHSSTSIYKPNFIRIGKTFCGRTHICTYRQTSSQRLYWVIKRKSFKKIINHTTRPSAWQKKTFGFNIKGKNYGSTAKSPTKQLCSVHTNDRNSCHSTTLLILLTICAQNQVITN